jgi:hypothetical protein
MGEEPEFTGGVVHMIGAYVVHLASQLGSVIAGLTGLVSGLL